VGVGVAGAVRTRPGWIGTAWLGGCVALGGLQPSMFADLIDTRRYLRRSRMAVVVPMRPAGPALPPIWHAPPDRRVAPSGPWSV
jgi:hypothetical protein